MITLHTWNVCSFLFSSYTSKKLHKKISTVHILRLLMNQPCILSERFNGLSILWELALLLNSSWLYYIISGTLEIYIQTDCYKPRKLDFFKILLGNIKYNKKWKDILSSYKGRVVFKDNFSLNSYINFNCKSNLGKTSPSEVYNTQFWFGPAG